MGTFPPAYLGQWRSATHFLTNSSPSAHYISRVEEDGDDLSHCHMFCDSQVLYDPRPDYERFIDKGLRINHCEIIKLTARCLEMTSCWYCLLFAAGLVGGSSRLQAAAPAW